MRAEIPSRIVTVYEPLAAGVVKEIEVYPNMWRSRVLTVRSPRSGCWLQGFILDASRWTQIVDRLWHHGITARYSPVQLSITPNSR